MNLMHLHHFHGHIIARIILPFRLKSDVAARLYSSSMQFEG